MTDEARRRDPHFLERTPDGGARVRLGFDPEETARIEEAAGQTPVAAWIKQTLIARAKYHVRRRQQP